MLALGAAFSDWIVALHIVAVVVAFGATFSYPVMAMAAAQAGPAAVVAFHRMQLRISRYVINPGLTVVVLAGIYLATDLHDWKKFFVQWGLGVAIVLGGLEGSYMIPREKRLIELAEQDPGSEEYARVRNQTAVVGAIMVLLVVITVFVMVLGAAG